MTRVSYRIGLLHLLLLTPGLAAAAAPVAVGDSAVKTQLFIAPSGEPFRASADEAYPVAAWFAGADTDRNGKLTDSEFAIDTERFFRSLDLDHNQQLTSDEIKRYENDIAPEVRTGDYSSIEWDIDAAPGRVGRGRVLGLQVQADDLGAHVPEVWRKRKDTFSGSGGGRYGIINIPEPVMGMDSDLNGIVTQREMRAAAQRRFKLLDTKERNYLLLAELPETFAQGRSSNKRKRR